MYIVIGTQMDSQTISHQRILGCLNASRGWSKHSKGGSGSLDLREDIILATNGTVKELGKM